MISPRTTVAPTGKRCTRCLCCMAVIAFDGEYLCAACDDGTHPALPEYHPAPPIEIAPPVLEPLKENETMTITSRRGRGTPIDPAIKRAVLAASPSVSNSDLARKYKITDVTVGAWRRAAGIVTVKAKRGPYKKTKAAAEEPAKVLAVSIPHEDIGATPMRTPSIASVEREVGVGVKVQIMVDEKLIDRWWASLDSSDKAAIFGANYVIRVEGTVS
jgi:hypothetical protein